MSDCDNIAAKKYMIPGKLEDSPYYLKPAGITRQPEGNVWKDKADLVKQWIAAGTPR